MKIEDAKNKLWEYAELDGTELGEACKLCLDLHQLRPYLNSNLETALENTILNKLKYFEENSTIETHKETRESEYQELVWHD